MGRAPCCEKQGLKKGPWTPDEDEKLVAYIQRHGHGSWRSLPKHAGLLRCGKSCRLRWTNYLRPDIKRGNFSCEEEQIIVGLHALIGNRWSSIASHLPGRTDNEIKNYWNTHLKKRLLQMGLDPVSHKPLLDANGMVASLKIPFTGSNHQRAQWESGGKQFLHLKHENLDILGDEFGIENKSSDHFLRGWRSNGGDAFRRGLSFSSSYLQQLRSCGLDVSGFLMQQRNESSLRPEHVKQDAIWAAVDNGTQMLHDIASGRLPTYSNGNSIVHCAEHRSPSSAISSVDCSTHYQSPESNYVPEKLSMDNPSKTINSLNQLKVIGSCGSESTIVATQIESSVKEEVGTTVGRDFAEPKNGHQRDEIWGLHFVTEEMKNEGDSTELNPIALQWSETTKIDQSLELSYPKPVAGSVLKEVATTGDEREESNLNGCKDTGPVFYMPLLAPEISPDLEFVDDTQLRVSNGSSNSSIVSWQDQFVTNSEETASESNNGEHYWSSLMNDIVSTNPLQSSCATANV